MPTARELLEEADALMRRNRALQADDIPLLTDSVAVVTEAQVLRGRGVASRGGPVGPATHAAQPPGSDAFDSIPTLTETVEEEVDAAGTRNDGGEPSDWLVRDAGEPSITGEVPDSVLVVPPPEAAEPVEGDPFFDDALPRVAAGSSISEDVDNDSVDETGNNDAIAEIDEAEEIDETAETFQTGEIDETEEIELVAPPRDAAEEAFEAELDDHAFAAAPNDDVPAVASPPSTPTAGSLADVPHFTPEATDDDVPTISDTAGYEDEAPREDAQPAVSTSFVPLARELEDQAPHAAPVMPGAVDDAAKWEGVAEEIRMQVLQRIDIFTDTGLREQLALRLQPIVDRASADLVATINQHVGDLLRAYVAEAIEREIESWRRSH